MCNFRINATVDMFGCTLAILVTIISEDWDFDSETVGVTYENLKLMERKCAHGFTITYQKQV